MADRKFKRHILKVIVLEEFDGEEVSSMSLQRIAHEINVGRFVGTYDVTKSEELSESEMANALLEAGSEPEFFDIEGDDE